MIETPIPFVSLAVANEHIRDLGKTCSYHMPEDKGTIGSQMCNEE
jgi:hypothetical protein